MNCSCRSVVVRSEDSWSTLTFWQSLLASRLEEREPRIFVGKYTKKSPTKTTTKLATHDSLTEILSRHNFRGRFPTNFKHHLRRRQLLGRFIILTKILYKTLILQNWNSIWRPASCDVQQEYNHRLRGSFSFPYKSALFSYDPRFRADKVEYCSSCENCIYRSRILYIFYNYPSGSCILLSRCHFGSNSSTILKPHRSTD